MGFFKKKTPQDHIDEAYRLMEKGSYEKAAEIFETYAEEGYVIAMLLYADCLTETDPGRLGEAIQWVLAAKEDDDPDMQEYTDDLLNSITAEINEQYAMGQQCWAENHQAKAMEWYTLAAQNNHLKAMCFLGDQHAKDDLFFDRDKAIKWYTAAAELGHVEAMRKLADTYTMCFDTENAIYWYEQAVDHGDDEAQYMLKALTKNK